MGVTARSRGGLLVHFPAEMAVAAVSDATLA
jgi:hypothetical protein